MPQLEESREFHDSDAFIHNHEACRTHGCNGSQCLYGSFDCHAVEETMPLAPPQTENFPQTSTAPFQTEHQQYLGTASEPPPSASYTSILTPGQTNFDLGPPPLPYSMSRPYEINYGYALQSSPMSNPDYINYGYAPQPSPMSNPDYTNYGYAPQAGPTSELVWVPPLDTTNIPKNNEWTSVCGVISPGEEQVSHKTVPETSVSANFKYQCPRCDKRFSRRYTVKQHFTSCIHKHGNPQGLKWIDHPSLDIKGNPYTTRKPNGWNLSRSQPQNHRFRKVDAATANQAEPGSPITPQADQQAHLHPGKVDTQPAVYTMPSDLEISQVDPMLQ